jgi:hypothetical protein
VRVYGRAAIFYESNLRNVVRQPDSIFESEGTWDAFLVKGMLALFVRRPTDLFPYLVIILPFVTA